MDFVNKKTPPVFDTGGVEIIYTVGLRGECIPLR